MKKILFALVCAALLLLLCSCGKGKDTVKIAISQNAISASDREDLDAYAQKNGYEKVKLNRDGTATIYLSETKKDSMLYSLGKAVISNVYSLMNSDSDYPYIKDIDRNEDFTDMRIDVVREEYEKDSSKDLIFNLVSSSCLAYLSYTGYDEEEQKVTVTVRDNVTKEIIEQRTFTQNQTDE